MAKSIEDLQSKVAKFRDDRDWKQFHTPKDLAMSIAIEAAELMECFQWKSKEDVEKYLDSEKSVEINEEMADILLYLLNLADVLEIDLLGSAYKKLEKNDRKYPAAKAKGNAKKYTEFE
ncbi:MAG: hypothetical protein UT05_C0015G0011 [Parcubacteria group bacterium GW2011_GWF2_38_76]|nr:MAG: hypothetical protein UT05_C0015G0011 [Parcubacteria group bacterium GW2011_GWF2_38_76]